jgi:hypothetical protein
MAASRMQLLSVLPTRLLARRESASSSHWVDKESAPRPSQFNRGAPLPF